MKGGETTRHILTFHVGAMALWVNAHAVYE